MINMCQGFLKDCESCKHLNNCGIYDAYQYGFRSNEKMTKAWEEVLQELEEKQEEILNSNDYAISNTISISEAIDIINQHLAEIEEGEEYG